MWHDRHIERSIAMYFRILQRDFKRKKTMNIVLLLFMILSAMFISSSARNLVSVINAHDKFFRMAGVKEYFAGVISNGTEYAKMDTVLEEIKHVKDYKAEEVFFIIKESQFHVNGHTVEIPILLVSSFENRTYHYYDEKNALIQEVLPGEIYIAPSSAAKWNAKIGDTISIDLAGIHKEFKIAGILKDAIFNAQYVGNKRILISHEDFEYFYKDERVIPYTSVIANISTDDVDQLHSEFAQLDVSCGVNFNISRDMIKNAYIMDVLVTTILMVFSIFIVLITLTILNFSIRFSIQEEFREIGVMKAIGLSQKRIRVLYMTKYALMAVFSSFIGVCMGIPFGNFLIKGIENNIVMNFNDSYFLNIIAAGSVVFIIILFSYHCTRKMKSYSPMDAMRNGDGGERYGKKSPLKLSRSRLPIPVHLALNDIFSDIRRYIVMLIAFTLSLLLIVILANSANTLKSNEMIDFLAVKLSDAYLSDEATQMQCVMSEDGREYVLERMNQIQTKLQEQGVPARVSCEIWVRSTLEKDDMVLTTTGNIGLGSSTDEYDYIEGSAPQSIDEIALTPFNAKRLGITIGDTIYCDGKECMVSGLYDCFINMGDAARLHQDFPKNFEEVIGFSDFQVEFTDDPDEETAKEYREIIKKTYPNSSVLTAEEYLAESMGDTGNIIEQLKNLAVFIVLLVCILTVVLMERSFISKEKSEIALLKALGFQNKSLMLWHSLRIGSLVVTAAIFNLFFSSVLTKICIDPIFKMLGVSQIVYEENLIENFIIYPMILIVFTFGADWLTCLFMKQIKASDSSNIE